MKLYFQELQMNHNSNHINHVSTLSDRKNIFIYDNCAFKIYYFLYSKHKVVYLVQIE